MIDHERQNWARRDDRAGQPASSVWPAAHGAGRGVGVALLVLELLLVVVAFWRSQPASGPLLWLLWLIILTLLVLAGITIWLVRSIGTIRYTVDDHQLTIRWMSRKHVVALGEIVEVEYDPHIPPPSSSWEPIWPGLVVWTRRRRDGVWRAWATVPPRGRVRIRTTSGGVEISPLRPIRFLVEIDRQRAGGPPVAFEPPQPAAPAHRDEPERAMRERSPAASRHEPDDAEPPTASAQAKRSEFGLIRYAYRHLFRVELLGDRLSSNLLAVSVIIPLLMVAYLFSQLAGVPDQIALHWDALGEVDRVGPPSALWQLPTLAALVLVGNTLLATALVAVDRFLSRLMLAATPVVQIIAAIALLRIIG